MNSEKEKWAGFGGKAWEYVGFYLLRGENIKIRNLGPYKQNKKKFANKPRKFARGLKPVFTVNINP